MPSLPYHEPDIRSVLIQASFLLLLNIVNAALDRLVSCGLLGQILIGAAWGSPAAQWLSASAEATIVQLGYLGLILIVFEGGLHTSFQSLKANLLLSIGVALTGIALPIALSYSLQGLLDATPLQAFAAGAALCSTSLGTIFTLLRSSGLSASRLGIVLTSAAIIDDVAGLVMVQVISSLSGDHFNWIIVVRPVLVSVAFAVLVPLVCLFVVKPVTIWINSHREANSVASGKSILQKVQTAFTIHTLLLIGLVASGTYAGISNLFTAYVAGATISWWDSEVPHPIFNTAVTSAKEGLDHESDVAPEVSLEIRPERNTQSKERGDFTAEERSSQLLCVRACNEETSGVAIYDRYYNAAVAKILRPFFFASIGFSIPITRMFRGPIVWRGIVYAALMAFAKLVCGLWLVRFSSTPARIAASQLWKTIRLSRVPNFWGRREQGKRLGRASTTNSREETACTVQVESNSSPDPAKPLSLHPALILAMAMCTRGEIGFLISGVAESTGIFSLTRSDPEEPSNIFLVVTWAITLCTIGGPLAVGLLVRRVKKFEQRKDNRHEYAGRGMLGA